MYFLMQIERWGLGLGARGGGVQKACIFTCISGRGLKSIVFLHNKSGGFRDNGGRVKSVYFPV